MSAIITSQLLDFIIKMEGLRTLAYQDSGGIWTCGVGHTGPNVRRGTRCTEAQARTWLAADLQTAAQTVDRLVSAVLTEGQRDALISFTFNVGSGAFEHSTLCKLVNEGRMNEAAQQFSAWTEAGGHEVEGLVRRRHAERLLFLS